MRSIRQTGSFGPVSASFISPIRCLQSPFSVEITHDYRSFIWRLVLDQLLRYCGQNILSRWKQIFKLCNHLLSLSSSLTELSFCLRGNGMYVPIIQIESIGNRNCTDDKTPRPVGSSLKCTSLSKHSLLMMNIRPPITLPLFTCILRLRDKV